MDPDEYVTLKALSVPATYAQVGQLFANIIYGHGRTVRPTNADVLTRLVGQEYAYEVGDGTKRLFFVTLKGKEAVGDE